MPPAGFEPAIAASVRRQTRVLGQEGHYDRHASFTNDAESLHYRVHFYVFNVAVPIANISKNTVF
jgi:hypothetical protein